jgi:hypothetical protein
VGDFYIPSAKGSLSKITIHLPLHTAKKDYTTRMPDNRSTKQARNKSQKSAISRAPRWKQLLLALSLVPLIAGGLLILLWAIDVLILQPADTQLTVGVMFVLLSFAVSNLVQANWLAAAGWLLLMVADGLLLSQQRGSIQYIAIAIGVAAVILFAIEIVRRLRAQNKLR